MKQFNLKEYLENPSRKVVTRDGKNVRIICTNRESTYFPIIALVKKECGEENAAYTKDGKYYLDDTNNNDLFFASEKHEGYICIHFNEGIYYLDDVIYPSEKDAKNNAEKFNDYLTIVKIEWEE